MHDGKVSCLKKKEGGGGRNVKYRRSGTLRTFRFMA